MKKMAYLLAAGAISVAPAMTLAGPGGHGGGMGAGATMSQGGGMGHGAAMAQGSSARSSGLNSSNQAAIQTSQGSTHGKGWDHLNGPDHPTGQPGAECEDVRPGRASSAPGSAFNPDGNAGTHYAGEQPQNSRNTSSVSQYDVACLNQENHH